LSSIDNGLKQHLLRVYSTLAATLAMAAIGAWAHHTTPHHTPWLHC